MLIFGLKCASVEGSVEIVLAGQSKPNPDSFSEVCNTKIASAGASWSCTPYAVSKASLLTWLSSALFGFFFSVFSCYPNLIKSHKEEKWRKHICGVPACLSFILVIEVELLYHLVDRTHYEVLNGIASTHDTIHIAQAFVFWLSNS